MHIIKKIRNLAIIVCITWISIHLFYYIKYPNMGSYTITNLIVLGFQTYIGIYSITTFSILVLISLILLYRYSKMIVNHATNQAAKVLEEANFEIKQKKSDLERQSEQLKMQRIRLEEEYQRKNMAKSLELEAIRKKMIRLKKNQYDPRKQPKIKKEKPHVQCGLNKNNN